MLDPEDLDDFVEWREKRMLEDVDLTAETYLRERATKQAAELVAAALTDQHDPVEVLRLVDELLNPDERSITE